MLTSSRDPRFLEDLFRKILLPRLLYSSIDKFLFAHPVEKHARLPGCVEGRCTNGYRSRRAAVGNPSLPPSPPHPLVPTAPPLPSPSLPPLAGASGNGLRSSSEQPRFEGLGRSMQRHHGNQTRRPPPLPTVHSTAGLAIRVRKCNGTSVTGIIL